MSNKYPLVSVIMSSYNHEEYVQEAIYSVLNQTYENIEFIINDDGSSDNTRNKVEEIKSDKINYSYFEQNQGAYASHNYCLAKAKGKYIAHINSDDIWVPTKLEKQIKFLEENEEYSAVFSHAIFKDKYMQDFPKAQRPEFFNIFLESNKSSSEWIRKFFFTGNALCHPSFVMKKSCFDDLGLYDPSFRQIPDFELWIRFLKKYNLYIIEENLVYFRIIDDKNASSPTPINFRRTRNETYIIFQTFFDNLPIELFKEAFHNYLTNKEFSTNEEYECEKAFLYFEKDISLIDTDHLKLIGLSKLHKLLSEDKYRNVLKTKYNFSDLDFMELTGKIDLPNYMQSIVKMTLDSIRTRTLAKEIIHRILKIFKK